MSKQRKIGQIVKIDLRNGFFVYGCDCQHGVLSVYDTLTSNNLSIDEIIQQPVIFTVGVLDVEFAEWEKVGFAPLNQEELSRPDIFVQDIWNLSDIRILDTNSVARKASFQEVQGLERAMGWHNHDVEQRIRDFYDGKTNWMVEFYRPKPPTAPHYKPTTKYVSDPGAIKRIDLGDGTYVYGHELPKTFLRVFDLRTEKADPPPNIAELPILFTVSISLSARLGWPKVGFIPLEDNEYSLPDRYMVEGATAKDIKIYDGNLVSRQATPQEIVGLEPAIMWDNYHVVNRLLAFYAGNPWQF